MNKHSLLSAAIALVFLPIALVQAQSVSREAGKQHEARAEQTKKKPEQPKAAPLYPSATREEPEQKGNPKLTKDLQALFELKEAGKPDEVIAKADAILADPRANAFDKASVNYLAGSAWLDKDTSNYDNAIKYVRGAVEANGLPNNVHYQLMLQLAQMLESDEKHAEALTYLDRFQAETKSNEENAIKLRAHIMLSSDKPQEAAQAMEALLAKKSNDKTLMFNLVSIYSQAGNDAKSGQMLDKIHTAGLLTESKDYDMAWRLLANIEGREKDALAIIDEGVQKKILAPDYAVYSFQGRSYYDADQIPKAIEAWSKAAPLAKDGEMYLNVAKLQMEQEHWADAKSAANSAVAKGVKKKGEAWQVLARSETGLGNKAAAKAATQESAKYPETKKWAEGALRQSSGK